jgi:hypothetical protein
MVCRAPKSRQECFSKITIELQQPTAKHHLTPLLDKAGGDAVPLF